MDKTIGIVDVVNDNFSDYEVDLCTEPYYKSAHLAISKSTTCEKMFL